MNCIQNRPYPNMVYVEIKLMDDDERVDDTYRAYERVINPDGSLIWWSCSGCYGLKNVDIIDDPHGESRDVTAIRKNFRFTMGYWTTKATIGALDPIIHSLDLPRGCGTCCCCRYNICCAIGFCCNTECKCCSCNDDDNNFARGINYS